MVADMKHSILVSLGIHLSFAVALSLFGWAQGKARPPVTVYRVSLVAQDPRAAGEPSKPKTPPASPKPDPAAGMKKDASLEVPAGPKYVAKEKKNVIVEKISAEPKEELHGHLQDALSRIRSNVKEDAPPADGKPDSGGVYETTLERLSDLRFNAYYGVLWETIKKNWVVPARLPECPDLAVDIGVQIASDGTILYHWIERPSQSTTFDYAALKAIVKSNPVPAPPRGIGAGGKLDVGFRFICS